MDRAKASVLLGAAGLFAAWLVGHFHRVTAGQEGAIRFTLGLLFTVLVLLRRKTEADMGRPPPSPRLPVVGVVAAVLAVTGIVFTVHQLEWLGVVALLYVCLRWSLPARFGRDVLLAVLLLYWLHPLPGQVFRSMEMLLQVVSIKGAETILHCLNTPVWADGLVLRAGLQSFGVPEACSGMRTAVTVMLTTFGVCVLFRLPWYAMLGFALVGQVQVVALNLARIVGMVIWAPRMPPEWSANFLHDTLGFLLLAGILLVQLEVSWWRVGYERRLARRDGMARGEVEKPDRGTILPAVWRRILRWGWVVLLVAALAGLAAFAARSLRPGHRAAMIASVVDDLLQRDVDAADRAVDLALRLTPGDRSLRSRKLHAMVLRGEYRSALQYVETLGPTLETFETILKSWALMAVGRATEALALVDALPAETRRIPGVAIVRAEYSAMEGRAEDVSRNLLLAVNSQVPINRIRALFPFLAAHEQWDAISSCDNPRLPYRDLTQAVLAVHAHLRSREMGRAAEALKLGLAEWPESPRFINSLFMLAARRPGGEWEEQLARTFTANVGSLSADLLATYLGYCFRLNRADLAWLAYIGLRRLDATDPALLLAPAQHGGQWFSVRRHQIGVQGTGPDTMIGLGPLYRLTRDLRPFASLWKRVPLAESVAGREASAGMADYIRGCLDELAKREQRGKLGMRLEMMYPSALALAERYDEAHARLDRMAEAYPTLREEALFQHALSYDRQAKWQQSYETLSEYREKVRMPNLTAHLMLINAAMNLDLPVLAMFVVEQCRQAFPGSTSVALAEAAIWDASGFKEQALFLLERHGLDGASRATAQLLHETGRHREAMRVSRTTGVRIQESQGGSRQSLGVPPAELSVGRRWPSPMTVAQMTQDAEEMRKRADAATSPFFRRLWRLTADWLQAGGQGPAPELAQWQEGFRTPGEEGAALYSLASLQAQQGRYDRANAAVEAALQRMPTSAALWRMKLALDEGAPETAKRAAAVVSGDPEVWLARLVTRFKEEGPGPWVKEAMEAAVEVRLLAVGDMVRAGDFLLRHGQVEAANLASQDAVGRCRGYLPAYVLAFKCALSQRDLKRALAAVLRGIEQADDPSPFYRAMVHLKSLEKSSDTDMVTALEYLRQHFPDDRRWAEQLAYVYFQKGDAQRTLSVLSPVIEADVRGIRVQSLLVAAEAARMEGSQRQSAGILEAAHALYPERLSVLNNLVYVLAQDRVTLKRARELLPALLQAGGDSYAVLDTAAMVHLRGGDLEKARQYMDQALSRMQDGSYGALEVGLNAAEILFRSGDVDAARLRLEKVRKDPGCSHVVELGARRLLREIELAVRSPRG